MRSPDYRSDVLVYAVVSAETEKAVELFVRREDAERFLDEVGQTTRGSRGYCGSSG